MNEKPKRKLGWRFLRWGLIGVACLVTLAAVLVTEENWRGKRAWENYKHELEAQGEKLDWQAFVPPPVPDDQNFFCAPIFTNIFNGKIFMSQSGIGDNGPNFILDTNRSGYAIYRRNPTDLKAWQKYYRNQTNTNLVERFPIAPEPQTVAKDVLFALSKYDSAVEELRQASKRQYAYIPLPYEEGINATAMALLPDLAALKRCTQLLQLRADAELADGQSQNALEDVDLLLYLNNSLRNSPFLISYLVRIAIVAIDLQPIWEGLAEHRWSDKQLAALETELSKIDFLTDYGSVMRSERAFAIAAIENQRRTREFISSKPNGTGFITNKFLSVLTPSAFFYQNELAHARIIQQWGLPLMDTNTRVISPAAFQRTNEAVQAELKHYSPYKVQALMLFPAISSLVRKTATIQASIDLARVACALERYRLAHSEYPETLDALAPQFIEKLPHDIINGQPLHYRRTDDGKFVLYSVGWNEKDDGGTVVIRQGSSAVDTDQGDWVWQYPAD